MVYPKKILSQRSIIKAFHSHQDLIVHKIKTLTIFLNHPYGNSSQFGISENILIVFLIYFLCLFHPIFISLLTSGIFFISFFRYFCFYSSSKYIFHCFSIHTHLPPFLLFLFLSVGIPILILLMYFLFFSIVMILSQVSIPLSFPIPLIIPALLTIKIHFSLLSLFAYSFIYIF